MSIGVKCWLLCLFISLPIRSNAQYIQPGLCDMYCHCPPGEAVVDCNRQDKLRGVPTNIPRDVTKLYVQEGDFPSPSFLTRANMTGLEQIEYLSIIYCNLQAIESKTFLGMTKLKHLDLSQNALRRLETYTFFGLQLVKLYLQEQHNLTDFGLHIAEDAFDGLTAEQINLRGNKLSSVQYSKFSKVTGLHRLILSDNRIVEIDEGFAKHFNGHAYLLDLTGNPLRCGCELAWIASISGEWSNSQPGLNMTCIYYHQNSYNYHDYTVLELRRLTADHLCPRSRIRHIEISIVDLAKRMILDCTAISIPGNPYPINSNGKLSIPSLLTQTPPEVAWQYVDGGHLREVRRLPTKEKNTTRSVFNDSKMDSISSTVRLNISLHEDARQYKCTTRSNARDAEEVVVTVRGPPKLSIDHNKISDTAPSTEQAGDKSATSVTSLQHTELTFTEAHYMLQPQFSLVQLALAVGGTFLATLILLFIGARCLNACHRHKILRSSSSTTSINGQEAKMMLHAGTVSQFDKDHSDKSFSPPKQNGNHVILNDPTQALLMQQSPLPQAYPQIFFSGVENPAALSNQPFSHLRNMSNQFFQPVLPAQTSSSSGTEDLQTSLAHLVSSPLIQPNSTMKPMLQNDGTLSPCLTNYRTACPQLAYWPNVAPGSPYSGSHEYDVPRFPEVPSYTLRVPPNLMTHRSSANCQNDLHKDFRTNLNDGTAL